MSSSKRFDRPKQSFPLVECIWNDASELSSGWTDELEPTAPHLVISVGFLIRSDREHIVIAMDLDGEGQHNGRSQIPRGMVKSIKILRKKD